MKREQQHAKQARVIQDYAAGKTIAQIQEWSDYTQSMIFHIIKQAGLKSRRAQDYAEDPDLGMAMNMFRTRPGAYAALAHADLLAGRPQVVIDDDEFKRMGCTKPVRLRLKKFLTPLHLTVLTDVYPALFSLRENKYYRLTYRELVLLHASPEQWLRNNAVKIRENWVVKDLT